MARARYFEVAKDTGGRPLTGVTVDVYQPGTTTPITETIYAAATGTATLTSPLSVNAQGELEFFLAAPKRVDLRWVKSGYTAETHAADVLDAEHAHSGTYAPVVTSLWIPTTGLGNSGTGTPVAGNLLRSAGQLYDTTANDAVGCLLKLPSEWVTYAVDFWWANAGAGTGNVAFRFDRLAVAAGATLVQLPAGSASYVAAAAQNVLTVSTVATALTAPASGELLSMLAMRIGSDANDTLANDVILFGVNLRKLT